MSLFLETVFPEAVVKFGHALLSGVMLAVLAAAGGIVGLQQTLPSTSLPPSPPQFTDSERLAIFAYWSAPGRYQIKPANDERVNITAAGSEWSARYSALLAERKRGGDPDAALWSAWVVQRMSADRQRANSSGGPDDSQALVAATIPASLETALGYPPPFYARIRPNRYTVMFAPDDAPAPIVYTDAVPFGDRSAYYGYYRSENGVTRPGKRLGSYDGDDRKKLEALFGKVGRTPFERRVLEAVSALEGGFEAINTYDTGFVSIGFIQFITARDGNGSLASVLAWEKANRPESFQKDFRKFGIDVAPDGVIVAVDPATGQEMRGMDAVRKIIDDKRLTAVFERAGTTDDFRIAQLQVARDQYWPGDDPVTVTVNVLREQGTGDAKPADLLVSCDLEEVAARYQERTQSPKIKERIAADPGYRCWVEPQTIVTSVWKLVRSEAGMATLMDRKVNRGNLRGINEAAADLMRRHHLRSILDVVRHERDLVAAMKYRADFLGRRDLSQPPQCCPVTAPAAAIR